MGQQESRERNVALLVDGTVAACCGWLGSRLCRSNHSFAAMFERLGVALPVPTRLLVQHGEWFYPRVFGLAATSVRGADRGAHRR